MRVTDPRASQLVQEKWTLIGLEHGVGFVHSEVRGEDFVVQGKRRLDQAGRARRRFGMPDQCLDGPDRAAGWLRTALFEDPDNRFELGPISGHGSGSMGLDEPQCRGRKSGLSVGPPQRSLLTSRQRCGQTFGASIARCTDTLDHGVDPVAITLRIGEALEDDDGDSLGDYDSIGFCVECAAAPGWRKRMRFAEA